MNALCPDCGATLEGEVCQKCGNRSFKDNLANRQQVEAERDTAETDDEAAEIKFSTTECFDNGSFIPTRCALGILAQLPLGAIVTPATTGGNESTYWWSCRTGVTKPTGVAFIRKVAHLNLRERSKNGRVNEVVGAVQRQTLSFLESFEETPDWLIMENGALNILTRELTPFSPKIRAFGRLHIRYDPEARCPKFLKFLAEILPNEKHRLGVQEQFGYCLLKSHPFRKAFMWLGEGANGKSTLEEALSIFLGVENVASVSLQELTESRFATAELHGKYANIVGDLPPVTLRFTEVFKQITGGDRLQAQRKFGQPFDFTNFSKQIYAMNRLPRTTDKSKAFFDRIHITPFTQVFEGAKRRPRDRIIAEITIPEELSGIMNFALAGLDHLRKNGDFTGSLSADDMATLYDTMLDPVAEFAENCLERNHNSDVVKETLYSVFRSYCAKKNIVPLSERAMRKLLLKHLPSVTEGRKMILGVRKHVWMGVNLRCNICPDPCSVEAQRSLLPNLPDLPNFSTSSTIFQNIGTGIEKPTKLGKLTNPNTERVRGGGN